MSKQTMSLEESPEIVTLWIYHKSRGSINPKKAGSFDPISQPVLRGVNSTPPSDLGRGAAKNYVIWHLRKPCRDE